VRGVDRGFLTELLGDSLDACPIVSSGATLNVYAVKTRPSALPPPPAACTLRVLLQVLRGKICRKLMTAVEAARRCISSKCTTTFARF
jgi:hypothetical protein